MATDTGMGDSMDSVNVVEDSEVRTLFVSGLPMDTKPRELYLMFRAYKGYEGSLLKVTGKNGKSTSPVGFVTFGSRCAAESAKQDLQGVRFDPDLPQTLRLEFAKSNTKVTKPKQQQSPQPAATLPTALIHPVAGQEFGATAFISGVPDGWMTHPLTATYADLSSALHPTLIQHPTLTQVPLRIPTLTAMAHPSQLTTLNNSYMHSFTASPMLGSPVSNGTAFGPTLTLAASSPCSTLFVANLGTFCSEQELKELFASLPGFVRLKMNNKGGSPVAFVEYQDVRCASDALTRLQGAILMSSERGGIRIEFAKNKMGDAARKLDDMFSQMPHAAAGIIM